MSRSDFKQVHDDFLKGSKGFVFPVSTAWLSSV
jgi:hypothetical protein